MRSASQQVAESASRQIGNSAEFTTGDYGLRIVDYRLWTKD